ncbi:ABC transporter ATP-binding protein [Orrella sp. JC864]|uniref:ABC transporter ATP-binding protein n=1 Tax=Orrella sp. JC864 TaxID=3120298 RepID=UPI00300A9133
MSSIVLDRVDKRYGDSHAVHALSLEVPAGSFTVLLGPSGCGKSTTLRMIAGLETPTGGAIRIGDRDVTALPPAQRRLSMVFQSYALFPHLSVRENILFGLKVRKEPAREHAARLQRVSRLLGLDSLLDRKPAQLSGGQQQRVALGRAVISEAPVCLMDEPLSNLDAQLRHEMRREIRALQRTLGMTMVYVTHDQTEAMSMADQVVLMNRGRIEQHGTPGDIYARPATEFAARFIGTPPMNLLALESLHGVPVLAGSHGPALQGARPQAARLGIRPENIRIVPDGRWRARVAGLEYFGADSIVQCDLGAAGTAAVRAPGVAGCAPGATVCLDWSPADQHFFDASGRALSPPAAPTD